MEKSQARLVLAAILYEQGREFAKDFKDSFDKDLKAFAKLQPGLVSGSGRKIASGTLGTSGDRRNPKATST